MKGSFRIKIFKLNNFKVSQKTTNSKILMLKDYRRRRRRKLFFYVTEAKMARGQHAKAIIN